MRQGQDAWSEDEKTALTTILTECSNEQGQIDWQKLKERQATMQAQLGRSFPAIKNYVYKLVRKGQLQGVTLRPPKSTGARRNKPAVAPSENGTSHRSAPVSGPNFCPNCGFRMREVYAALGVQADLAKRNQ